MRKKKDDYTIDEYIYIVRRGRCLMMNERDLSCFFF